VYSQGDSYTTNPTSKYEFSGDVNQKMYTHVQPCTHRKLSFPGEPVKIPETVMKIHANHVLNIGVEKFGKFLMGEFGEMWVWVLVVGHVADAFLNTPLH